MRSILGRTEINSEIGAEFFEAFLLPWIDENKRDSFFSGAGGSSTAVGIKIGLVGELVVDDE